MTTASTASQTELNAQTDPLMLIDVDHVRFNVGNAKQAAYFYAYTFGFQIEQYADLTTGSRDQATTCSPRATSASCSPRASRPTTRRRKRSASTATASRTSP